MGEGEAMEVDAPEKKAEAAEEAAAPPPSAPAALRAAAALVRRSVAAKEAFLVQRALRATAAARRKGLLKEDEVGAFAGKAIGDGSPLKASLDAALPQVSAAALPACPRWRARARARE